MITPSVPRVLVALGDSRDARTVDAIARSTSLSHPQTVSALNALRKRQLVDCWEVARHGYRRTYWHRTDLGNWCLELITAGATPASEPVERGEQATLDLGIAA